MPNKCRYLFQDVFMLMSKFKLREMPCCHSLLLAWVLYLQCTYWLLSRCQLQWFCFSLPMYYSTTRNNQLSTTEQPLSFLSVCYCVSVSFSSSLYLSTDLLYLYLWFSVTFLLYYSGNFVVLFLSIVTVYGQIFIILIHQAFSLRQTKQGVSCLF